MTQEETIDYNKRCAKFLGWKETSEQFKIDWVGCKTKERFDKINKDYIPILEKDGNVIFPDFTVMDFSRDWNWIMEVVEAIEKIDYKFQLGWNITALISLVSKTPAKIALIETENRKEAVVQAINQFLIWYEQNKTI